MPVKPFVFENYKNNEQILCYESKGIILNPNDIYKIMLSLIKILNILYNNKIIDKPKILSGTSLLNLTAITDKNVMAVFYIIFLFYYIINHFLSNICSGSC